MDRGNLGGRVGRKVDLMVDQSDLGVPVEETKVSRVCAGAERNDLLRGGRIGFEELRNQKINGRSANVGAYTD